MAPAGKGQAGPEADARFSGVILLHSLVLAAILFSGPACTSRAMTYTGLGFTIVGVAGLLGGASGAISCHETTEGCIAGGSAAIATWLGVGLVASVAGVVLMLMGPEFGSSDAASSNEEGLTGEAGVGPVPSSARLVEAPR